MKLFEIYGRVLKEVEAHTDLGHVRVRKLQVYLWNWSDRVLREFKGDPEAAHPALFWLSTNRPIGSPSSPLIRCADKARRTARFLRRGRPKAKISFR